jgi:predicted porin
MKISTKAAIAAACACPLLGGAQVNIGGIMDGGVRLDNGSINGSIRSLGSGLQAGSRLTFSGVEDLGGGLEAGFVLESGLSLDTGTGAANPPGAPADGLTFGRTASVSVGSAGTGYVSLGRQYTPLWAVSAGPANDPFGANWLGGIGTVYSTTIRTSNSIVYSYGYTARTMLLPAPRSGFGAAVMYAPGEAAAPAPSRSGDQYGFNLSYGDGTWWVGYGYHQTNGSASTPAGTTPHLKQQTLGASYQVGPARLYAGLNTGRNDATGTAAVDRHNWHVGALYTFGGLHTLRVLYGSADSRTSTNVDFKNWQLGYQYDFSKRTNGYLAVGQVNNGPNAAVTTLAALGTYAKGATATSTVLGIRHNF